MKIVSFNVNSVRARLHQVKAVVDNHHPAVIGLQETKVRDEEFPVDDIKALGYDVACHGQKGHYGVALLYRVPVDGLQFGFPTDEGDSQKRFIGATFTIGDRPIHIYNGYFPQGENRSHPEKFPNKERFYQDIYRYIADSYQPSDPLLIMGDMNVAPLEQDIGIGEDNRKRWLRTGKCCFLPEEREWLQRLVDWGLVDSFPALSDNLPEERYSWFDYRSKGFERDPRRGLRIDLMLATEKLLSQSSNAGIDYHIRSMERPSDHAPVWLELNPS